MSQSGWDKKRDQRIKTKSDVHEAAQDAESTEYLLGRGHPFDKGTVNTPDTSCCQQEEPPLGWCNEINNKTGFLAGKRALNRLLSNLFVTSLSVSSTSYPT